MLQTTTKHATLCFARHNMRALKNLYSASKKLITVHIKWRASLSLSFCVAPQLLFIINYLLSQNFIAGRSKKRICLFTSTQRALF